MNGARGRELSEAFHSGFSQLLLFGPSLGTGLAMHSLLRLHGPRAQPLPQPSQEITDFQGVTHESGASAQDRAAFNNHRVKYLPFDFPPECCSAMSR